MMNDEKITKSQITKERIYDLEERTAKFGEAIIEFAKKIPKNIVTTPLIGQLVKAGTSVGVPNLFGMRQMMLSPKRIFCIRLEFVRRNRGKPSTG